MLYYDRIDVSKGIDLAKSNNSKECMICHYWFFNQWFKFQDSVCDGCHDLTMFCLNITYITIISVKNVDYCCIIYNISKPEATNSLEKAVLEKCGIYKKHCLKFQSIQDSFFYLFCLLYKKWLIVWISISL